VSRRVVPALATGILAGAALSWLASIWIRSLLYGVQPFDPWSASAALVLLLAIGIAAAAAPAFRAVRMDPASTLRQE
jgi:ABC-type antimicrobial peptide transport system permease subunit